MRSHQNRILSRVRLLAYASSLTLLAGVICASLILKFPCDTKVSANSFSIMADITTTTSLYVLWKYQRRRRSVLDNLNNPGAQARVRELRQESGDFGVSPRPGTPVGVWELER